MTPAIEATVVIVAFLALAGVYAVWFEFASRIENGVISFSLAFGPIIAVIWLSIWATA